MNAGIHRIYILGAPGSGVSTLGKALAEHLGFEFFDADDYYWFTDDPLPYRRKRNPEHRRALLQHDLDRTDRYVLAGALSGWGEVFTDRFDVVIYRWLPAALRLSRIERREVERYGLERIQPGGDLHSIFQKFLIWVSGYDTRLDHPRSRQAELAWLSGCSCPTLRLEADDPVDLLLEQILKGLIYKTAAPG